MLSERRIEPAPPETAPGPGRHTPETERRIAAALAEHFDTVWRSVRRFGVGESHADDATQRVFMAFAERIAVVEPGRERPYLIGIAVRVAANVRRQCARSREESREAFDDAPGSVRDPESLLLERQRRQTLDQVLATLPDLQREIFVLYELEGFSMPEIASALDIPLGTVASRLRRARESFTAWVQEHLPSSGEP